MILDDLFVFPIVMIDGDSEDRKKERYDSLAIEDDDVDIIIGEAECLYEDFLSVSDRWLPTTDSLKKALQGKFEACYVIFSSSGGHIVPWNKKRFKSEYKKFVNSRDEVTRLSFDNKDEAIEFLKNLDNEDSK